MTAKWLEAWNLNMLQSEANVIVGYYYSNGSINNYLLFLIQLSTVNRVFVG